MRHTLLGLHLTRSLRHSPSRFQLPRLSSSGGNDVICDGSCSDRGSERDSFEGLSVRLCFSAGVTSGIRENPTSSSGSGFELLGIGFHLFKFCKNVSSHIALWIPYFPRSYVASHSLLLFLLVGQNASSLKQLSGYYHHFISVGS